MLNKIYNVFFFALILFSHFTYDCCDDLSRFKGRSEGRVESRVDSADFDATPVVTTISYTQR